MKHLKTYRRLTESGETKIFESNNSVDYYLNEMDTTRRDVIDVFQGIIDLGYEPEFRLRFLDKSGRLREEKSSGQETPLLTIKFSSPNEKYIGGSIRFNNINYIENLYHSLAMFMSMYKDKCNIEYELDNMIELKLILQFDTEYDETKLSVSKDEISDALNSCLSIIPEAYASNVEVGSRSITLEVKPDNTIGQKLLDQLKASKTAKVVSNLEETEKIGLDIINELAKVLSERFKKDIRYVKGRGVYLFNGDKEEQRIFRYTIGTGDTKRYKADIKRGFLKTDKCEIQLETLVIEIKYE